MGKATNFLKLTNAVGDDGGSDSSLISAMRASSIEISIFEAGRGEFGGSLSG